MPLIDPAHPWASVFLLVTAAAFLAFIALPLMFAPLWWARRFRWKTPPGKEPVTLYFGRCLGALATAVLLLILKAVPAPMANLWAFELIFLIAVLQAGTHLWGALRHLQPWTETVELLLYAGEAVLALLLRFRLAG